MHSPNQYILPLFVFGTLVITAFAVIIVVFLVIQKQRQVKSRLERQQLEFDYNRSLLDTKIEVQEQALKMVSQEIHDNVGQVLSSTSMQLTALRGHLKDDGGKELLEDTIGLVRKSVKDLRLLSHSLNNGLIETREIDEAIQSELDRIQAFSGVQCSLDSNSTQELAPEQRLLVFRIVQEALQNILKHAAARNIKISINAADKYQQVLVKDDGKGFDATNALTNASLGMTNMKERATLLKANLNVMSSPGAGTTIELLVPINS